MNTGRWTLDVDVAKKTLRLGAAEETIMARSMRLLLQTTRPITLDRSIAVWTPQAEEWGSQVGGRWKLASPWWSDLGRSTFGLRRSLLCTTASMTSRCWSSGPYNSSIQDFGFGGAVCGAPRLLAATCQPSPPTTPPLLHVERHSHRLASLVCDAPSTDRSALGSFFLASLLLHHSEQQVATLSLSHPLARLVWQALLVILPSLLSALTA
jgi:hypothetical protein